MSDLARPLAVIAEAAGAANIILAWLARNPGPVRPFMAGPAISLWKQRFPATPLLPDIETAIEGAGALLSGTGWSDVEYRARMLAQQRSIPSVAVVDHWVNYRARFMRDGLFVPADTLWVTDEHALALARRELPEMPAVYQPNYYLKEQVERVAAADGSKDGVLYVLEPFADDWGRGEPGEFQALGYLLENLGRLGVAADTAIRLRLHPMEPPGKYDKWLRSHAGGNVTLDDTPDLAVAIARAEYVAGGQTFALVIALAAGVKAVCTLPPWAPPCVLPHEGLIHLQTIAAPR